MADIKSLYEELAKYCSGDVYPFHMPGHKRNTLLFDKAYSLDITEISGFDNLHHPTGIIKDIQNEMSKAYSSDKTYILVAHNGIARMVNTYFFEMTNEEFAAFKLQNGEVREYRY